MAGGNDYTSKNDKAKQIKKEFSSEFLDSSSSEQKAKQSAPKSGLMGILGLGQSVELGQKKDALFQKTNEVWGQVNGLNKEIKVLYKNRDQELEKAIKQLRTEIKKLLKSTKNLDVQVEKVALEPETQANPYQRNFLERVRQFIKNFRKNIDQASLWMEAFQTKKKKKNYFWKQTRSKKGGTQFMFSGEHSASRSAA